MFAEDLSAFFSPYEHATPATLGGNTVAAIFDNGYTLGAAGPFGIATTQPRLTLPTTQVPADCIGQAVVVAGQGYVVAEHQPDGTGISLLMLEATA